MSEPPTSFRAGWREAPWTLKAFAIFLLGLFLFEGGLAFWNRLAWFELPSLRYTLEIGYLMCVPLLYNLIKVRRQSIRLGIVAVLVIQVLYAASLLFVVADRAALAISWTIASSLLWLAVASRPGRSVS